MQHTLINDSALDKSAAIKAIGARLDAEQISLDEAADALLAANDQLGRMHGTYTEAQLTRRMRDEHRYDVCLQCDDIPEEVNEHWVGQRLESLIELARLNSIEEICLRLSFANLSVKEIRRSLGIGRRRTALHLRQARKKLRRVYREGPYAGWFEVYLSEVRRGRQRSKTSEK